MDKKTISLFLSLLIFLLFILSCDLVYKMPKDYIDAACTPVANEQTKYLCVIKDVAMVGEGKFSDNLPKGTKLVDSGIRWTIAHEWAKVYWKGYMVNILIDDVEECE
jgi:hypothetical protein